MSADSEDGKRRSLLDRSPGAKKVEPEPDVGWPGKRTMLQAIEESGDPSRGWGQGWPGKRTLSQFMVEEEDGGGQQDPNRNVPSYATAGSREEGQSQFLGLVAGFSRGGQDGQSDAHSAKKEPAESTWEVTQHGVTRDYSNDDPALRQRIILNALNASHSRGTPSGNFRIQRKVVSSASGFDEATAGASVAQAKASSTGQPLDKRTHAKMSAAFGNDLGDVRIHTGAVADTSATDINAKAYTTGNDVFFGAGQYSPHTEAGEHLLAHELAHVVQQRSGAKASGDGPSISSPGDDHEIAADRAADAVVAGRTVPSVGGASAHGIDRQAVETAGATSPSATTAPPSTGLFVKRTEKNSPIVTVRVDPAKLPPAMVAMLAVEPQSEVSLSLSVQGTQVSLIVSTATESLVATLVIDKLLSEVAGPSVSAMGNLSDKLPNATAFAADAAKRITPANGSRIKLQLWCGASDPSFVVVDLARAMTEAWNGRLTGLRPVEAHLQLGGAGRLDVFADDQVKALDALPPADTALGDLEFESPELRRNLLGLSDEGPVHATVYYSNGKLAVGIKPTKDAVTGVVTEVDLAYLLNRLRSLGSKVGSLIDRLLVRMASGARDFLKWVGGALSFDLDLGFKSFFEFDFKLSLPRLGSGKGFSLANLWPTSWSFELPGLTIGALPKFEVPWLKWPKLGSLGFDISKLTGLFSRLGLPSLPALPGISFDVHFRGLELGLALDLSKLWPDLDFGSGGSVFGLDLDLSAVLNALAKAGGAIADAAKWLGQKLRAAGAAVKRWVHLGADGVIRIFDQDAKSATTPMLGFSLLRLLDGAQATDLLPSEIRFHGKGADLEMGLAANPGETGEQEVGATVPQRPDNPLVEENDIALPASAVSALGLADGVHAYVSVAGAYPNLVVYAEAKSGHREGNEAIRMSVDTQSLVETLSKHLPSGPSRKSKLPVPHVEARQMGGMASIIVTLGSAPEPGTNATVPYARASWSLSKLIARDFVPDELTVDAPGKAGVTRGPFNAPAGIVGQRFAVAAPGARKDILGVEDGASDVWLGVYYADLTLALTATPSRDKNEGVLGKVNVVWLLRQLEKLGKLGEKVLDAIGSALGKSLDKVKGFAAKLAAIASGIGHDLLALAGTRFELRLKGSGSISWDFGKLIDRLSLDGFDLDGLIPDISGLAFPQLPGFSFSFSSIDFGGGLLDKIRLPSLNLDKLFGGMNVDWSKFPSFDFSVFGLDDFALGISLDLSFLKGLPGLGDLFDSRKIGFRIDLNRLLAPFGRALEWLKSKLPNGQLIKGDGTQLKLGSDGVLRIWDNSGAHLGFALTRLFDGFDPADIVPVEMQFAVTTGAKDGKPGEQLAKLQYGQAVNDNRSAGAAEAGQVLMQRPNGKAMARARFDAPPMVAEHLAAPKGADLEVQLYKSGEHKAAMFATITGSDRGMLLEVDTGAIQRLVKSIGPKAPSDLGGVQILWDECKRTQSIVIGFGQQPGKAKQQDVKPHGHARWRMSRFFDGLELGDLVPDEAHCGVAEGGVSIGMGLDVSGLKEVATISVPAEPSWISSGLGSKRATVFANANEQALRVALVAATGADSDEKVPRPGIELDVASWFLDSLETKVTEMVKTAGSAVGSAFKKTARAGQRIGGDLSDKRISLARSAAGLRLQRGNEGEADHLYATFGWTGLVNAVSVGDLSGLVPVELRLATSSVALEIQEAALPGDAKMPKSAKRIGGMHALFKDALGSFGLSGDKFLDLSLGESPIVEQADGGHTVNLVGMIYTADGKPPQTDHAPGIAVEHASRVTLAISLEALLAQVLPRQRKFANQKKNKKKKTSGTSMSLGFRRDLVEEEAGDQMGIGLDLTSSHTSKKTGRKRTVEVHAGWTAEKLIGILMNLDDIVGDDATASSALGLLTPDVIRGSFENHLFKLEIGNNGKKAGTAIECGDLPLLPDILSSFVDIETARKTVLHLAVEDGTTLAKRVGTALLKGDYVSIGSAAIEMPGSETMFGAKLLLSLGFLEKLAGFIPHVGLAIKIIRAGQGLLTDPKGTMESLAYTPELLFQTIENAPEIFEKLKGMSIKDIALGLMSNDASTKDLVYASRVRKKMDAAGIKLPDGSGAAVPTAAESAWLMAQDPAAIKKSIEVSERLAALGLTPDLDENAGPPQGKLNVAELETFQAALEAGFTEFAEAREVEATANSMDATAKAKAAANTAAAAEKFRKQVAAHIAAGAKARQVDVSTDEPLAPGEKAAEVDEKELTRVDDLPEPDADQAEQADAMFSKTQAGMDPTRVAYLVQKFAFLTTAQLGTLLDTGSVEVVGKNGKHIMPLWESERPYARSLFVLRVDPNHTYMKQGSGGDPKAVATDAELIAAWKNREAKAAEEAAQKAKKAGTMAATDTTAKGATADAAGSGESGGGAGSGADGGYGSDTDSESMDEALWGEEPGGGTGSGESGQGLDADGDGALSTDELAAKGGDGGESDVTGSGVEGDAASGGTVEATSGAASADGAAAKAPEQKSFVDLFGAHVCWWDNDAREIKVKDNVLEQLASVTLKTSQNGNQLDSHIAAIDVINSGNTAADGQSPKYEYTVNFEIEVTGGVSYTESKSYIYLTKERIALPVGQLGGDDAVAAIARSFVVKDGKVVSTGVPLTLGEHTFDCSATRTESSAGSSLYRFDATLTLTSSGPATLRNRNGEFQELKTTDAIEVRMTIVGPE